MFLSQDQHNLFFEELLMVRTTARNGWLATTTEYLDCVSRASGGGGSGTVRTGAGICASARAAGGGASMWESDCAIGRGPQPAIARPAAMHAALLTKRIREYS